MQWTLLKDDRVGRAVKAQDPVCVKTGRDFGAVETVKCQAHITCDGARCVGIVNDRPSDRGTGVGVHAQTIDGDDTPNGGEIA